MTEGMDWDRREAFDEALTKGSKEGEKRQARRERGGMAGVNEFRMG